METKSSTLTLTVWRFAYEAAIRIPRARWVLRSEKRFSIRLRSRQALRETVSRPGSGTSMPEQCAWEVIREVPIHTRPSPGKLLRMLVPGLVQVHLVKAEEVHGISYQSGPHRIWQRFSWTTA